MSRLEKILAMLETEPEDMFLRYTLAMEYRKLDQSEKSIELLKGLIEKTSPPFVPAFLMAAQQLSETEQIEEARSLLRVGIEEARRQNDLHAASEMGELLSELGK
jgi:thioredoxin-like negative regulator of GroEL